MKRIDATISDVARVARVSEATVSNAINGRHSKMSDETLNRVRKVIAELNFRPSSLARQLKSGELPMIGLLVPSIANPFFGALAREAEDAARQHGYGLLLCNTNRDADRELQYAEAMLDQGIRGVIVGAALSAQRHLPRLYDRGLALVGLDRQNATGDSPLDIVSVDNYRAAVIATEHLCDLGHKSLAYVTGALTSANRVARLKGFRQTCKRRGVEGTVIECDIDSSITDAETAALGHAVGSEMRGHGKPTGVVAVNDMVAMGLLSGLAAAGRRVPEDVSVVGIDDIFLGQYSVPPLTTVRQPLHDIANHAVQLILARIQAHHKPFEKQLFEPVLIERGSARAR